MLQEPVFCQSMEEIERGCDPPITPSFDALNIIPGASYPLRQSLLLHMHRFDEAGADRFGQSF
jgi:hypothetical protein